MKKLSLLALASLFCICQANAITPYLLPDSDVQAIHSTANNKNYELFIKLPSSYKTATKKYPLVLVNDTRFAFPLAGGMLELMGDRDVQEAIVVGISYSAGDDVGVSRTRDYTPTYAPKETSSHSDEARQQSGQADKYIKFIAEEVLPLVIKSYRIDENKKIFVGHSFGGLLGAYILVKQPELFDYYILGSPSLWYDNKAMFKLEEAYYQKHKSLPAKVAMFVGSKENNNYHTMVDDLLAFEKQIKSRKYQGLQLTAKVLDDENHHSVFPALLSKGLVWAIPLQ